MRRETEFSPAARLAAQWKRDRRALRNLNNEATILGVELYRTPLFVYEPSGVPWKRAR